MLNSSTIIELFIYLVFTFSYLLGCNERLGSIGSGLTKFGGILWSMFEILIYKCSYNAFAAQNGIFIIRILDIGYHACLTGNIV